MTNRNSFITIALSFLMAACTAEEATTPQEQGVPLSITVSAEGFVPTNNVTRATDKEYATNFVSGDQIGVFAISEEGVVLDANVPYQCNGTTWAPVDADNAIHQYHYAGVTYFAYYPYSSAMDNAVNEAGIISSFTPKTDQSTQTAYSASDLMTGTGTVANEKLNVSLSHKMSLIVIRPEGDKYIAGDYEYRSLYTTITAQQVGNVTAGYEPGDGTIRYLIPANTSANISIEYTTMETASPAYSTVLNPTAGKYYKYNIQTGGVQNNTFIAGDFYMVNGSILPKATTLTTSQQKNCIGIIFKVGAYSGDTVDDYDNSILNIHAYVVALDGIYGGPWGEANDKSDTGANDLYRGYYNTKTLLAYYKDLSFFAAKAADDYNMACPLGEGKSKWYLPAEKQLEDIYTLWTNETLNFLKAGASADFYPNGRDNYWLHSSTGIAGGTARVLAVHIKIIGNLTDRSNVATIRIIFTF